MFDLGTFIGDCRAALAADASHRSVREVVARAVSDAPAVLKGLGEPKRATVQRLYHSNNRVGGRRFSGSCSGTRRERVVRNQ